MYYTYPFVLKAEYFFANSSVTIQISNILFTESQKKNNVYTLTLQNWQCQIKKGQANYFLTHVHTQ